MTRSQQNEESEFIDLKPGAWKSAPDYQFKIGRIWSRSEIGLALVVVAILIMVALIIGKALGTTKHEVVSELPQHLFCQPFKSTEVEKGEEYYRNNLGFKPIPYPLLGKAFSDQSAGKGEVLPQASFICFEKLGRTQTVRASMYYFSSKSK